MKSFKWVALGMSVVAMLMMGSIRPTPAADNDSPEAVVLAFQNDLIAVMKEAETLTVRERFDRLAPAVDRAFHMPLMVQIAVGSYWRTADKDARVAVLQSFRRMSIATLATLFDGYGGEVFEHQKNNPGPSKTIIVMTDLVKTDNSRVQIAYVTREFKRGWRIIDVVVDGGISELKVRRSEYNQILKNDGISGLVGLLNGKADELMAESATN